MDVRIRAGAVVLALGLVGTAACDSEPMAAEHDLLPAALVVPAGAQYQVTVCKDGPPRTYSFGITAGAGTITLPYGNTFNLGKDECKLVATTTAPLSSVEVVENTPPAGTLFWKVELYNFGTLSPGGQSLKYTYTENKPIKVAPFGGDNGWVVVYYNIFDPATNCTLTQGFWKNHEDAWPVASLMLGTVTYDKAQLLAILKQPVKGNGLVSLASQLIAAKLNIIAGADGSAIATAIADADALIGALVIPPIGSGSLAPSVTSSLNSALDSFNRGVTGPGHCGGD